MLRRLPRMAVSWTADFLAKAKPSLPQAYALKSARASVVGVASSHDLMAESAAYRGKSKRKRQDARVASCS